MIKIIFLVFAVSFVNLISQSVSPFILVDQFGYLPNSNKVALIRDPQIGFDASESFEPSSSLQVRNALNDQVVFTNTVTSWRSGNTDPISGDKVWYFDFTNMVTPGQYFIFDQSKNVKSNTFTVSDTVYKNVLKAALKTFFYQRAGCAKDSKYAGEAWADGASHLKLGQDINAKPYNDKANTTKEKDLRGGWFDAGDYNKYTSWTAYYVIELLNAYHENKSIWTDDINIPESGNGIPDIVDELKWGMDWLLKMQQTDGSCLCVLGVSHASPPSSASGASNYGPATTNASLKCAAAFALGSKYLKESFPSELGSYSDTLRNRAIKAWNWSLANPYIQFHNNVNSNNSTGLAAGDQETDSLGRFTSKMSAALYLFELTNDNKYLTFFENNIKTFPLFAWNNYLSQYFLESQALMMRYTNLQSANATLVSQVKKTTIDACVRDTADFVSALQSKKDPYLAYIKDYNWGSNQYKSKYGNFYWLMQKYGFDVQNNIFYNNVAQDYIHYIHGVNPFNMVYLSNMSTYGAENSVNEFYHSWFTDKSAKWDRVGQSTYGPAPGFLTGGPNSSYSVDGCCPNGCGSTSNNALCTSISNLPVGQPPMKSYKDFNSGWPLNSWSVTENSNGYQVDYIRLLSKYVNNDVINSLSGPSKDNTFENSLIISPNPTKETFSVVLPDQTGGKIKTFVYNSNGLLVESKDHIVGEIIDMSGKPSGMYCVRILANNKWYGGKLIKQ